MLSFLANLPTYILPYLVVIGIVITVHELGHFLAGKWTGAAIDRFSFGFGPTLVAWRDRAGVEWRIGGLPLGGYVRFSGDENAASVPDSEDLAELRRRVVRIEGEAAVARYFHFKPLWQRAFIIAAGPLANFLLSTAIFAGMFFFLGDAIQPARIDSIAPNSPAQAAGFKVGDLVERADGRKIDSFASLERLISLRSGTPMTFVVQRGGRELTLTATPRRGIIVDDLGNDQHLGTLGIEPVLPARVYAITPGGAAEAGGFKLGDLVVQADGKPIGNFADLQRVVSQNAGAPMTFLVSRAGGQVLLRATPHLSGSDNKGKSARQPRLGIEAKPLEDVIVRHYGPLEALGAGAKRTYDVLDTTVDYIGRLVRGEESAEQLSGPLGMATVSGKLTKRTAEVSPNLPSLIANAVITILDLAAYISVGIGFLNLLPIPVLDGGHLLFYAYEAVARRPLAAKVQAAGYRLGLALVLGLMLFATWNDLQRLRVLHLLGGLFS
jgi:regulator of sigma E protease